MRTLHLSQLVIAGEGGRSSIPQRRQSSTEKPRRTVSRRHCEERQRRSNPCLHNWRNGSLCGACHRARIRTTRWLAMTKQRALEKAWSPKHGRSHEALRQDLTTNPTSTAASSMRDVRLIAAHRRSTRPWRRSPAIWKQPAPFVRPHAPTGQHRPRPGSCATVR